MSAGPMNAERLLAHYEKIADAPDAIARLRRFVLDLAVRGKLVPQEAGDVSPAKLLAEARKQLRAQAETAKRMRWKQTDPVAGGEIDKDVPCGWVAARVNDTGLYINGLAFKPADWKQSGIPIIRIQNLTDPQKEFNYAQGDFPDEVMVRDGDLLVSWSATLEAFKWDRGEGVLNQHIFRVIPHQGLTDRGFLLLLLRNAIREMADSEHAHGLVMAHINRGPFLNHVVLIPPLAEQRRIVAKMDELMVLLDRLEAAHVQREATRDRLTNASLARFNAPDPETFKADARFALDALPALTTRPDQIKALRQTILNLAVRGKLVPQDAKDEPAAELLKRLKKARAALEAEGKVRKDKGKPPSHYGGEQGFDLPGSWSWARLTEIGQTQTGTSPSSANADLFGSFIPFIKPADLDGNQINYDGPGLSEIGISHSRLAAENSILMVCIGATLGKVNTTARPVCFNQQINSLTPFLDGLTAFVAMALKASDFQSLAWSKAGTGTLPIISKGKWEVLPIPLPPLAEQHRIVAKVDALMALCDRLEASLTAADATRRRLLDALLAEALAPVDAREKEAAE